MILHRRPFLLGLLSSVLPLRVLGQQTKRLTSKEQIEIVLRQTKPLQFPLGQRLPLYVWAATNLTGDDAEIERTLQALSERGMAAYSSWKLETPVENALAEPLRVAAIQKRMGLRINVNATDVLYGIFDGSTETAHIDADNKPFFDTSSSPKRKLGCPFVIKPRLEVIRERVDRLCRRYSSAKLPIDFIFADWEIDGPIEWNEGWATARKCVLCRQHIPDIDNFKSFQKAYRDIRSQIQRECYSQVVLKYFPKALVGNYSVYPNDGWRYWYDYYETEPSSEAPVRIDQRAKYRPWVDEFKPSGYTYAMPVVYTWYRIWNWYDWANGDYRWFYNLLLVANNAAGHTPATTPIISFVHYSTTSPPPSPDPTVKQFSEASYRELLWHMLLRGHDTFFLWCPQNEIATEIRPLHEVWSAALEYKEFLDHGTPITFEVPNKPGPVVSGLRLGDRVLVRRTDFDPSHNRSVPLLVDGKPLEIPPSAGKCQILWIPGHKNSGTKNLSGANRASWKDN